MRNNTEVSSKTWRGIENYETCIALIGFVYSPLLIFAAAAALLF